MSLIETQVIASIIETGDVASFLEAGLTTSLLAHKPERAKELAWILDHNSKFGKVPSPERFKNEFPGFVCPKRSNDNPAEIVADVKASSVDHKTRSIISEMVAMGQDRKTSAIDMFALLKKKVSEVEESVNPSRDLVVNSKEFVDEFMGDYKDRQLTNGVSGVPWPWPTANQHTLGVQPDDVVVTVARPGVGKALAHGEPVLTPTGYVPIESLSVGDLVIGIDGGAYPVTGVFPQGMRDIYRVTFSDGTHVDCDIDHLWEFIDGEGNTNVYRLGDIKPENLGEFFLPSLEWKLGDHFGDRALIGIKFQSHKEATCISVDAPRQLFLTRNCVPTHNTWFLVVLADYLWKSGFSILFVSNELTTLRLAQRQVAASLEIGYHDIRSGSRDVDEIQTKLEKHVLDSGKKNFIITANDDGMTAGGVSFVDSKIGKYKPDVVIIDGGYLLEDDMGGKDEYQRAGNVIRQLKAMNKRREVPVFITWQINRNGDGKNTAEEISTKHLGLSDKVGQDASYIIALSQTEDDRLRKQMKAHYIKTRESGKFSLDLCWDFEAMCFDEMVPDGFNLESEQDVSTVINASSDSQTDIEDTDWSKL